MPKAKFHGHRVLLFTNNPQASHYIDETGMSASYDILTAPDKRSYSVQKNAVKVEDGDIGVVYRTDDGSQRRDPGNIVAVARVTSSPWYCRTLDLDGEIRVEVNWDLQILSTTHWITSKSMKQSGLWDHRAPLGDGDRVTSPVHLDQDQWDWIAKRLPSAAVSWLEDHATGRTLQA